MTILDVTYTDPLHGTLHVVVSSAFMAGGSSFDVYINNYYQGKVVRTSQGWIPHVRLGVLSADDLDAIMEAVEKAHP